MTNWTYEEFLAFTMLYAASADMNISEEEEVLIKQKLNDTQYQEIKSAFDSSNDATIIDTILSYHDQYIGIVTKFFILLYLLHKILIDEKSIIIFLVVNAIGCAYFGWYGFTNHFIQS